MLEIFFLLQSSVCISQCSAVLHVLKHEEKKILILHLQKEKSLKLIAVFRMIQLFIE